MPRARTETAKDGDRAQRCPCSTEQICRLQCLVIQIAVIMYVYVYVVIQSAVIMYVCMYVISQNAVTEDVGHSSCVYLVTHNGIIMCILPKHFKNTHSLRCHMVWPRLKTAQCIVKRSFGNWTSVLSSFQKVVTCIVQFIVQFRKVDSCTVHITVQFAES